MTLQDLQGKNVCIVGFGKEGKAALAAIERYRIACDVTIADKNSFQSSAFSFQKNRQFQWGENYLENLDQFDVIIKSPGVPPCPELEAVKAKVTSGTALFLEEARKTTHTVIGITGSKGKSTTASLIHHILHTAGKRSVLLGNIGVPALEHIDDLQSPEHTFFVMELSSYQLADIKCSPHIAVITSFFPEHLDYHDSLKAYKEAKGNIARFQETNDVIFYASETKEIADVSAGKKMSYSAEDITSDETFHGTELLGRHNLCNIAGAWQVADYLQLDKRAVSQATQSFAPLPHRLEEISTNDGICWINDSISTTPESTIAAIDAFEDQSRQIHTLILGGQDRGLDFSEFIERIANSTIQAVICLPDSGHRIVEDLQKSDVHTILANTLEEAVEFAKQCAQSSKLKAQSSSIILLSPASPSYNQFKNFEEKGDAFRECIMKSMPSHALSK